MLQAAQSFKRHRRQIMCLVTTGLVWNIGIVRSQGMSESIEHFKSFMELQRLAIRKIIGESATAGGGLRPSLPVPMRHQGQVQVAFMFCFFTFRPGHGWILPPDKVVRLDPVSGQIVGEATVSPSDFSQTDPTDKPLKGDIRLPPGMTIETYKDIEKSLYALYEVLFAPWATNPVQADHAKLQNPASQFLKIFDQVSEKPLRPYYYALGNDWFRWLRELTQ